MNAPSSAPSGNGRIVTFYSYKGGVGRSMALANIAVLLAKMKKRVLAIDWDLEAPGLHQYFPRERTSRPVLPGGLLGLLELAEKEGSLASYRQMVGKVKCKGIPSFDVLVSGDELPDYGDRVANFSWKRFFENGNSGQLEALRTKWKEDYDFVLIDSRTGVSDSGGICTIQLPDSMVFVLGANEQNLEGCQRIVAAIHRGRAKLPYDRGRLLILPLLSRFDGREESDLAKEWLHRCAKSFKSLFDDWLPKECTPLDVLERTKLPHVPRYSFGEKLAVLRDRSSDPDQLPYYYLATTRLLVSDFRDVLEILGHHTRPVEAESIVDHLQQIRQDPSALAKDVRETEIKLGQTVAFARYLVTTAGIVQAAGNFSQAEEFLRRAYAIFVRDSNRGPGDLEHATVLLARLLFTQRRLIEAESLLREHIPVTPREESGEITQLRQVFADVLHALGRSKESELQTRIVLNSLESRLGGDDYEVLSALLNLGTAVAEQDRADEAEKIWRDALRRSIRSRGPNDAMTLRLRGAIGNALSSQQRLPEAERHFRDLLRDREMLFDRDDRDTLILHANLGIALARQEKLGDAEKELRYSVERLEHSLGMTHPDLVLPRLNLVSALANQGKLDAALDIARIAEGSAISALGKDHTHAISAQAIRQEVEKLWDKAKSV